MVRQIVFDTETTGMSPDKGDRVVEIGCIELMNRQRTGKRFHTYLNPECSVGAGAVRVHGLTSQFLADKPRFRDIAAELSAFIEGAELIAHNAPFDVRFFDHEFRLLDRKFPGIQARHSVIDTLVLAKKKYPGKKNNLDALCKRLEVDNSSRALHGALLDAEILAEVYLRLTIDQRELGLQLDQEATPANTRRPAQRTGELAVIRASEAEARAHERMLQRMQDDSGVEPLFAGGPVF